MSRYDKIFGIGPILFLLGIIIITATSLIPYTLIFEINNNLRTGLLVLMYTLMIMGLIYSMKSLPVKDRGNRLITSNAFSYTRHPLYSSILLILPFIIVLTTFDNKYFITGLIFLIIAHFVLKIEEKSVATYFGDEYIDYQKKVPMIIPYKLFKK